MIFRDSSLRTQKANIYIIIFTVIGTLQNIRRFYFNNNKINDNSNNYNNNNDSEGKILKEEMQTV